MTYYAIYDRETGRYYRHGCAVFSDMPKLYARRSDAEWRLRDLEYEVKRPWRTGGVALKPVIVKMEVTRIAEEE